MHAPLGSTEMMRLAQFGPDQRISGTGPYFSILRGPCLLTFLIQAKKSMLGHSVVFPRSTFKERRIGQDTTVNKHQGEEATTMHNSVLKILFTTMLKMEFQMLGYYVNFVILTIFG